MSEPAERPGLWIDESHRPDPRRVVADKNPELRGPAVVANGCHRDRKRLFVPENRECERAPLRSRHRVGEIPHRSDLFIADRNDQVARAKPGVKTDRTALPRPDDQYPVARDPDPEHAPARDQFSPRAVLPAGIVRGDLLAPARALTVGFRKQYARDPEADLPTRRDARLCRPVPRLRRRYPDGQSECQKQQSEQPRRDPSSCFVFHFPLLAFFF